MNNLSLNKQDRKDLKNLVIGGYLGISAAWTAVCILNWTIEIFF